QDRIDAVTSGSNQCSPPENADPASPTFNTTSTSSGTPFCRTSEKLIKSTSTAAPLNASKTPKKEYICLYSFPCATICVCHVRSFPHAFKTATFNPLYGSVPLMVS